MLVSCGSTDDKLAKPDQGKQLIVAFKSDATKDIVENYLSTLNLEVVKPITKDGTLLVQASENVDMDAILNQLNSSNLVRYAEPNYPMKKSN